MTANQVFLTFLAVLFVVPLAVYPACIQWLLRRTQIANISYIKAFGLLLLFLVISSAIEAIVFIPLGFARIVPTEKMMSLIGIAVYFLVVCATLMVVYRARFSRALIATFFYSCIFLVVSFSVPLAIRWQFYDAFTVPTNSMAPTMLGDHLEAPCPNCGAPAYGLPRRYERGPLPPEGLQMICSRELRTVHVKNPPAAEYAGDHIVVCKQLAPKRWDLIAFREPVDSSVILVKRLVGLPAEKVAIRDGSVWINDNKLDPPASIQNIRYEPTIQDHGTTFSGPGSVPVTLAKDEYYVLGDFQDASSDSRLWEKGAPGHPPYAVPAENIIGVVTNIYWPPSRWTSFR